MKKMVSLQRKFEQGFSLIELMVAMVVSLVIMAGVVNSFLASKDAFNYNSEMAFIQDNARFAANRLEADIRSAGDFGCLNDIKAATTTQKSSTLVSKLGSTASLTTPDLYLPYGLQGYNTSTNYPNPTIQAGATGANNSDAILVRHTDVAHQMTVSSISGTNLTLTTFNSLWDEGTIMVYTDPQCKNQIIFQSNGQAKGSTQAKIGFATGGADSTKELPGNLAFSISSLGDAKVAPLSSAIYYVATSTVDPTMKSLWVFYLANNGAPQAQELILGVDDMRIYYGVDTDTKPDGFANKYVTANTIGTNQDGSSGNYVAWNRVASVRVQLLLRSRNKVSTSVSQKLQWDTGSQFTKNDGYLWQIASTTIRVRNAFRG